MLFWLVGFTSLYQVNLVALPMKIREFTCRNVFMSTKGYLEKNDYLLVEVKNKKTTKKKRWKYKYENSSSSTATTIITMIAIIIF